jgi:von Willebrand factor type A domain
MRRPDRIPLAGAADLRRELRLSRGLRIGIAVALVGLLAASLALALDRRKLPSLLPTGADGVIVLDVSGSVGPREYGQLAQALDEAVTERRRYGLVIFSDVAYEVFPPGTDPAQVRAVRRFFVPTRTRARPLGTFRDEGRVYLASPWAGAFTGGTRISHGLALAHAIVRRDRLRRPAVLLISDLEAEPRDFGAVERVLAQYARDGIPLRVVGLRAREQAEEFFDRIQNLPRTQLAGPAVPVEANVDRRPGSVDAPVALGAACLGLLLLLAANELACGRLTWAPTGRPET